MSSRRYHRQIAVICSQGAPWCRLRPLWPWPSGPRSGTWSAPPESHLQQQLKWMNDNDTKITSWSDCPKLWSTTLTMTVSDSMPVPSCGSASLVVTRARLFCDLGAMVVQQGEDDELNKCETGRWDCESVTVEVVWLWKCDCGSRVTVEVWLWKCDCGSRVTVEVWLWKSRDCGSVTVEVWLWKWQWHWLMLSMMSLTESLTWPDMTTTNSMCNDDIIGITDMKLNSEHIDKR